MTQYQSTQALGTILANPAGGTCGQRSQTSAAGSSVVVLILRAKPSGSFGQSWCPPHLVESAVSQIAVPACTASLPFRHHLPHILYFCRDGSMPWLKQKWQGDSGERGQVYWYHFVSEGPLGKICPPQGRGGGGGGGLLISQSTMHVQSLGPHQ